MPSPHLDPTARAVVEASRDLARRRRHGSVEPEHLLRALLDEAAVRQVFQARAVDVEVLPHRIDARLAAWPVSGLYRDGDPDPPFGAALDPIWKRAGAAGWLGRLDPPTPARLARAAFEEPSLASLLFEARAEIAEPAHALEQARLLACMRGHRDVSVQHVLRALAEQPWMMEILNAAGVDSGSLLLAIDRRLDAFVGITPDTRARFVLPPPAGRNQLLLTLLRTAAIEEIFWAERVAVVDVIQALARLTSTAIRLDDLPHDDAPPVLEAQPLPPGTDELVDVIFHDDDFTTKDFVVSVLSGCFALPPFRATSMMLSVHENGAQVVGTCASRDARWRLDKARTLARRANMPLRITWSPARPLL